MRHLPIALVYFLLFSCTEETPKLDKPQHLTEEQKRNIYIDSFAFSDWDFYNRWDSSTSFEAFMDKHYPDLKAKNKYDPYIYALEEPYIDTTRIDPTKHWFRFTVIPVFSKPYSLIVEKLNDKTFLRTKITNGYGGYYTGTLSVQLMLQYRDTLYNNLLSDLERLKFWSMPQKDTSCSPGRDGETWTFEILEGGKYKLLERWLPEKCGDSRTRQLAQVGQKIRELSKLNKALVVLGEQN